MQIIMCGIPRSGSTLVWQILNAVFPTLKIQQTHPTVWKPDGKTTAIITIRDPRDILTSRYRVRLSRDSRAFGLNGLEAEFHVMNAMFNAIKIVQQGPHYLLRYEEFYKNYNLIYSMILTQFGVIVEQKEQQRLNELFSIEANKQRAAQLKDFNSYDKDKIHGDHLGAIYPGSYRLSEFKNTIIALCESLVKEWDYELD